jgi:hypothetical protein
MARSATKTYAALAALALVPLGLAGCGTPRGSVSGTVKYQGKPVIYGTVMFVGTDNIPVVAMIQPDGSYRATEVLAGNNQVAINSPHPDPPERVSKSGKREPPPVDPDKWFMIPGKYGDARTSGLSFAVKEGSNTFPIELE